MAPVISSMSDFISRGIRRTAPRTAGSRWLGMPTPTVLSPSPHGPSERSEMLPLPLSPWYDLPGLHNNSAATPLHATVFSNIRHQRPAVLLTAGLVPCSHISRLKKNNISPFPRISHDRSLSKRNEISMNAVHIQRLQVFFLISVRANVTMTLHCLSSFIFPRVITRPFTLMWIQT